MKLIQITTNTFDWNILIDDVLMFIKASSFEKDYVLQLCLQAEYMLYQYTHCVIIKNTYKMISLCNDDVNIKYKSLVLKTDFCDDMVTLDTEYEAGYDILVDTQLQFDMFNIILGLYNKCTCESMYYINKYKEIIGYIENEISNECC